MWTVDTAQKSKTLEKQRGGGHSTFQLLQKKFFDQRPGSGRNDSTSSLDNSMRPLILAQCALLIIFLLVILRKALIFLNENIRNTCINFCWFKLKHLAKNSKMSNLKYSLVLSKIWIHTMSLYWNSSLYSNYSKECQTEKKYLK